MSIVVKGKKGAGTPTFEQPRILIGTRSTCHVVLEDPMAAEKHAAVLQEDGKFFLEDLGTSSGTYLNGAAVEGRAPIPAEGESTIVIGVSRILATVDAEKGNLVLNLKEGSFFYDKKEDPLAWSRAEVELGRFRGLKASNLVAVAIAVLLVVLAMIDPVGDPLLEPGPVAGVHTHEIAALGFDRSCDACHEPFGGTPPHRCERCHADIVTAPVHPPTWDGQSCQPCHIDHLGTDPASLTRVSASDTCGLCHEADRMPAALELPRRPETRTVPVAYNTFPHDVHLTPEARAKIGDDCRACHLLRPPAESPDPSGRTREFQVVMYETCKECHAPGGRAETSWEVAWHGTDEGSQHCLQCHETLNREELRTVERIARDGVSEARLPYTYGRRSHGPQLEAHQAGDPEGCVKCHKDGIAGGGGASHTATFPHRLHLSAWPPSEADRPEVERQCRACHAEQLTREGLESPAFSGAGPVVKEDTCASCHTDAPAPFIEAFPTPSATTRVNDFPHHLHLDTTKAKLADGCLSCHSSDARSSSPHANPTTAAESRSCKACHEEHREIGGGHCATCHRKGDPVYSATPLERPWPDATAFSHQSRGHVGVDCESCHVDTGTAKDILSVRIPVETDRSCRECHIAQRQRFHYR